MYSLRFSVRPFVPLFLSTSTLVAQETFPTSKVDSVFASYNRTNGPGCALGVYRNGGVAYTHGYGMADLNQGIAITPRTAFYIASTSKQFTAASLSLLAAQGKLSLDDPVRKYIPELPDYATAVTLGHLMHHVSGIRDYLGLWQLSGRSSADQVPEEQALDLIARQHSLDFPPGSRWAYSNSNYFLISVVVKRVSGMSLRDFARTNLFQPLGMQETHFHDDNSMVIPHRAEGYEPDSRGGYRIVRTSFALVGDGGLYTTVEDLAKWDENFFSNRLAGGGPEFIRQLYTRGMLTSGDTTDYAAGLFLQSHRGLPVITHGGSFIGFRAELLRFPTQHTSIAVLCNDYTAPAEALAKLVADLLLAGKLSTVAAAGAPAGGVGASVAEETLDRYAGRFELLPGVAATVARNASRLELGFLGQKIPLTSTSDSTFTAAMLPGTITFRVLPDGRIGLHAPALGMEAPAPPLRASPVLTVADRQALIGRYFSDELQATVVVRDVDGRLEARGGYGNWMPLDPFQPGEFSAGSAKVSVVRDAKGRVTGLRMDAARMKNIALVRLP